ncbi:L,D-transpeptidase family protein [Croceibacterium sp. LX-88]|uniref:L,D-transpeptidase family protein n=1 Tax=Croceibacterium selenioxidans TaxID=2838833 RepID=A0ABS5W7H8_9SPHN|nr:L,D-transpeptidase family protein [Croceibacterium selenioxidans]MBT2135710.1 L,D-transpeptidase family protein [Croceibacterium selenioxidans]
MTYRGMEFTMKAWRKILLAGVTVALGAPVAAQQIPTQRVLDQDAEVVTAPMSSALTLPPAVVYPAIMHWSADSASKLLAFAERIGTEGLDPSDYKIKELRAAILAGEGAQLDEAASLTFTWLVEDLRDGRTPMDARRQWFVIDPDADLMPTGELMQRASQTGIVAETIQAVLPTHPDYAALREALAVTPQSQTTKRDLIRANMDRWRWLQRDLGVQYLLTNVPEYQLRLTVNNNIIRSYRTIVGKPGRTATPQLAETVEGVIFNPTWTVPQSIVKGEGLGAKVLGNPGWARANGYRGSRAENGFVTVVQQPGPGNSLGQMKLDMPNPHSIFLHDTPSRNLFASDNRALSHGCVRVERALELAMTIAILGQGATREEAVTISTSGEYTRVPVQKSMPVYITYFTMARDIDGQLRTFNDIYGRDAPVVASFKAPRVGNRSRVTDEEVIEIVDDLQTS